MKIRNLLLAAVLGLCVMVPCRAQAAGAGGRLSFLNPVDRAHLLRVHRQVLAENPDLKSEQQSLMTERQEMKAQGSSLTPADRRAFREKVVAHSEKMDAAMRKDDPTVEPILEQVKAHARARRHPGQGQSSSATNTQGAPDANTDDDSAE
jgi:hypothetical protein